MFFFSLNHLISSNTCTNSDHTYCCHFWYCLSASCLNLPYQYMFGHWIIYVNFCLVNTGNNSQLGIVVDVNDISGLDLHRSYTYSYNFYKFICATVLLCLGNTAWSHPWFLALRIFPLTLLLWFQSHMRRGLWYKRPIYGWALHSYSFSAPWPVVHLC